MSSKLLKFTVVLFLISATFLSFSPKVEAASSQFITKGTTSSKVVALTFDDGSDGTNIQRILQILTDQNVTATFFLTGSGTANHPQSIKNIVAEGHQIANHSYSHPDFTELSAAHMKSELERTEATVKSTTGKSTKPLFRAPFGSVNSVVLNAVGNAGFTHTIHWTIDTLDWKGISSTEVTKRVMNNIVPGAIVLMHTGAGAAGTPVALPAIISQLKSKGYQFVTVSDLLKLPSSSGAAYTVKSGDTLYSLARKYNVTVSELVAANRLADASYIKVGQVLVIPTKSPPTQRMHSVIRGDTVYSLARQYNVTVSEIVSANNLTNPSLIRIGQVLAIPTKSAPSATTYTVKAGDTLYSIARKYGTTVQSIAADNELSNPSLILIGTVLFIRG